jgi:hypothetical protein
MNSKDKKQLVGKSAERGNPEGNKPLAATLALVKMLRQPFQDVIFVPHHSSNTQAELSQGQPTKLGKPVMKVGGHAYGDTGQTGVSSQPLCS